MGPRKREAEGAPDEHSQLKELLLRLPSAPRPLPIFPEMKWRRFVHLGELLPQTLKANVVKDMKKLESCALLMGTQNGVTTMDKRINDKTKEGQAIISLLPPCNREGKSEAKMVGACRIQCRAPPPCCNLTPNEAGRKASGLLAGDQKA